MEKFKLVAPTKEYEQQAVDYINEFYKFKSKIHGTGGLQNYLDNYDEWLQQLDRISKIAPNEDFVPARTFFFVRESDNKIIGIIDIRLVLNERLKRYGGNIGYSIRPTERGKGYNKINLYLALKVCQKYGLEKVLLDADTDNPASWKTMEALGGVKVREYFENEFDNCYMRDYKINVNESIDKYGSIYEPMICNE